MSKMRFIMHENKAIVSAALMAFSLIMMIMGFYALPDANGNEGSGPLSPLLGWNYILILLTVVLLIVNSYIIYRFVQTESDRDRETRPPSHKQRGEAGRRDHEEVQDPMTRTEGQVPSFSYSHRGKGPPFISYGTVSGCRIVIII